MCGLRMRPGAGKLVPAEMRSKEWWMMIFQQPTISLARALLGKLLVKETELGTVSGWIVETEAYIGPEDRAAHGFGNRRTKRTEVMFGPPGYAYFF